MIFIHKKLSFLLIFALWGTFFTCAHAELSPDIIPDDLEGTGYASYETGPTANDVLIEVTPENPGPYQDVTLRTTSDYIDLNRYNASWYVDGKRIATGIGQRTATVKTRGYGQRTNVIILIQLPSLLIKKTFTFEPQDITIMWEAVDSYVPPFYEGKKLPPQEGIIKAVVIPNFKTNNGKPFDSTTGVYRWVRNENVVGTATGYGKNSFTFKNNKIRAREKIEVTASDQLGNYEATQAITIPTFEPKILFYEKNPQTGLVSPFSLTNLSLLGSQTVVQAEPFFFSLVENKVNTLTFNWKMNKEPIHLTDTHNKQAITLENSNEQGSATLYLDITNPNSLFQTASTDLFISLGKK